MEARLSDILWPTTDDKNWGIKPTPVPRLSQAAAEAVQRSLAAQEAAKQDKNDPALQQAVDEAAQEEAKIKAELDEGRKRSEAMEAEIEDQLRESDYNGQGRLALRDGVRIGTGVLKGPIVGDRPSRGWTKDEASKVYQLTPKEDVRPAVYRVDPWSFFPDPDVARVEDGEGVFERHLKNKKQMRALARGPHFIRQAIAKLIEDGPKTPPPQYFSDLRAITGQQIDTTEQFCVWEYHGPLTAAEMRDLALHTNDDATAAEYEEEDPLAEVNACVWFCQDQLLKFGIYPLDSGDPLYSVWNLEPDDASIFGFGVPYIMRDAQRAYNSAWRMMMDNGALGTGPQILMDRQYVEPSDGSWDLLPRKVWELNKPIPKGTKAFDTFSIDMHQAELANIIELAAKFIDEETGLPLVAEGESGSHVTQTMGGMSMLMNAANIVFRRPIKAWDDQVTSPLIRRFYDFNMQFSKKEHIKGDYEVDARGSSVLLVRELQSQNLMIALNTYPAHPVVGPLLKDDAAPLARRTFQSLMLPAEELLKSDDEIRQEKASTPPMPDPEMAKLENARNLAKENHEYRMKELEYTRETELIKLAQTSNVDIEKINADAANKQAELAQKDRGIAVEAAFKAREPTAPQGGGSL